MSGSEFGGKLANNSVNQKLSLRLVLECLGLALGYQIEEKKTESSLFVVSLLNVPYVYRMFLESYATFRLIRT